MLRLKCSAKSPALRQAPNRCSQLYPEHYSNRSERRNQLHGHTTNASSYHWDFGDGTTATTQEAFHHYKAEGIYQVNLAVSNAAGCKSNMAQQVSITSRSATSLPNLLTPKPVSIWSAKDLVFVGFSGQKKVQAEIEIYNIIGQMISRDEFNRAGVYSKEVNLSEASYIVVRVKNEDETATKKVYISNR